MLFKAAVIGLGLIVHLSSATVFLGTSEGNNIAWIDPSNPCFNTIINHQGIDPCGIAFTLSNDDTYALAGCGTTNFRLNNADGSFNHACSNVKAGQIVCSDRDTITTTFSC